jgi:MOSC domain-containing protein YiiM
MRVLSVNVGLPREVEWQGERVRTGIFKEPVAGPIALRSLNFDGDAQADLTVHGGRDKAVYAYPHEHYEGWRAGLGREIAPGGFGENLTTEGLTEDAVHIGDEFRVGTARVVATQPRLPCFKLGLRFGDPLMVKRFLAARRPGIYFAVVEEGAVGAGDPVELLRADENQVSVLELLGLALDRGAPAGGLERALRVPTLAEVWRKEFEARLRA